MPTLNWIGKEKVINHHQDAPLRVLEHQYGFTAEHGEQAEATGSGNMIIHGDNLEALKALLPYYEGKIKCIYIDPPYNTGNEGWVYNDNVNHPKIKKWLGQVVGKEGDDLSRHDKWLCMMYPRLKMLHKLLARDGTLFISIDDISVSYLKLILDEVFGTARFIGQFIWKSRQNKDNRTINGASIDHEYVLCYGHSIRGDERDRSQFKNPDNDPRGDWTSGNMVGLASEEARPNLHYDLVDPATGINYGKPARGWRYDKQRMAELIEEDRILWPPKPTGRPRLKVFLEEYNQKYTGYSSIICTAIYTYHGSREIENIFGTRIFDFPKSSSFVENLLIQGAFDQSSLVLDSFAGSGTTAHAVLNMNKQDAGNRKFILIEMEDYADSITAERVKRVMRGYGPEKSPVEGTGGSFDYYELGPPLFLDDGNLNEAVGEDRIRAYIWYSETRAPFIQPDKGEESPHFLGVCEETAYYFFYERERLTTLNYDFLATLRTRAGQYVIYADNCTLDSDFLQRNTMLFKKIPRDITRL